MSTLSIGRVGLDLSLDPVGFDLGSGQQGQIVGVSGEVVGSQAEAIAVRNELHRMSELPDLIVPVAFSTDPTLDGLYKLDSVTLDISAVGLNGFYPFYARLMRTGAAGRIGVESRMFGGLRTNTNGITTGGYEPLWAVPDEAVAVQHSFASPTLLDRVGEDGTVRCYRDADYSGHPRFTVPADSYFNGAAKIELGSTLRVRSGLDAESTPTSWRLSNGLFRVSNNPNDTSRLLIQIHEVGGWKDLVGSAATSAMYVTIGGVEISDWDTVSIIRNDAAAATLRFQQGEDELLTMDLTIRRGCFHVEGKLTRSTAAVMRVGRATADAGTNVTGGIRDSANDGNGNRWVLASPDYASTDTTNGRIVSASVTEFAFMMGAELNGSGASSGNAAADLINQYHAYVVESLKAIIR